MAPKVAVDLERPSLPSRPHAVSTTSVVSGELRPGVVGVIPPAATGDQLPPTTGTLLDIAAEVMPTAVLDATVGTSLGRDEWRQRQSSV
jgi:hypothetical protein